MNDHGIILNPLLNPIFIQVLFRAAIVYIGGLFLILLLHHFRFKDIWESNVGRRYLSWLVIGPLYLVTVFFGGYLSLAVLLIVLFLAIREVKHITGLPKSYIIGLCLLSAWSVYIASFHPEYFYSLPLVYFLVLSCIALRRNDEKNGFFQISIALFICIWIIFSLSHFVLLGHLNNTFDTTKSFLLMIGFAVPLSDVFAYVIGRACHKLNILDKYKIASRISKHKTYVGILGNILGAGLGVWVMAFALKHYLPVYHLVILSVVIGVSDVLGGTTESLFKRYYNRKDSGRLIPGHGGMLDRIDSALRVIVIVYYYLLFFL